MGVRMGVRSPLPFSRKACGLRPGGSAGKCISESFREMKGYCPGLFGFLFVVWLPYFLMLPAIIIASAAVTMGQKEMLLDPVINKIFLLSNMVLYILFYPYVLLAQCGYALAVLPDEGKKRK